MHNIKKQFYQEFNNLGPHQQSVVVYIFWYFFFSILVSYTFSAIL